MQKKESITIQDIAHKAGVSASTVSRVLNNTVPVASDKRDAILAAIEALNYRPNIMAQNLVRGRSMAIGVLTQHLASSFYGRIHQGIEQGLEGSGYQPMFVSGNWHIAQELVVLDTLIMRQVDGLIILGGNIPDERLGEIATHLPLVAVGRRVKGFEQRCLQIDNIKGAYDATRHLLQLGHRRIVHIMGLLNQQDALDRRTGYIQALQGANLDIDPELIISGNFNRQAGLLAINQLISRGILFTAIFAANDEMAYGARLGLYQRGIRVPEDISLVGFDDQDQSAYTTPPLTTMRQSMIDMGLLATQAILNLIQGEAVHLPLLSTQLVVRESSVMYRD